MTEATYYQKAFDETKVVSGEGDPEHFENEAGFLSFYAEKLVGLLRESDVRVAVVEESSQLVAVGFPEGLVQGGGQLQGIMSDACMDLDKALEELDWRSE